MIPGSFTYPPSITISDGNGQLVLVNVSVSGNFEGTFEGYVNGVFQKSNDTPSGTINNGTITGRNMDLTIESAPKEGLFGNIGYLPGYISFNNVNFQSLSINLINNNLNNLPSINGTYSGIIQGISVHPESFGPVSSDKWKH